MLRILLIIAGVLYCSALRAQLYSPDDFLEDYSKEFSVNVMVYQKSIGFGFTTGKILNEQKTRLLEFQFVNMRHPKEIRVQNATIQGSGSYTANKLNMLYLIRAGMGMKYKLADKRVKNSVEVSANFVGGPVLGFVKPVYLEILRYSPDNPDGDYSIERYDPAIHNNSAEIVGSASMFRGLGDSQLKIGLWAKASLCLDWSDYADEIKMLEIGVAVDAFANDIPILAFADNLNIFPTCFIAMHFGSRW